MPAEANILAKSNELIQAFEAVLKAPVTTSSSVYYTGVDLGTAFIVMVVLDENKKPAAGACRYAEVVRDGMVVDYIGALKLVREMKAELEDRLQTELLYAAAAIPPGTGELDSGAVRNVVEGAGFELTALPDESTAANEVLQILNGAVVDIGGGTTGISIFKDGRVVAVADEATGGTHLSLVIAGAGKMSFAAAEAYKRESRNHRELMPVVRPVIEKIATIITTHIAGYDIPGIYLVGGTCCLEGIETVIGMQTGIPTYKPHNPMFVTPVGIALSCTQEPKS